MARIVLAEDDGAARALLARALRADGHEVIEAEDGQAALARLQEGGVDIVVSDVDMPGMDGIALAEATLAGHAGTKIILMSGYAEGLDRAGALTARGVRNLPKPVSLEAVRAEIRSLMA